MHHILSLWRRLTKDVFFTATAVSSAEAGFWIQDAIVHPGALRHTAELAGQLTQDGTINITWLKQMAIGSDATAAQARLALRLREMH